MSYAAHLADDTFAIFLFHGVVDGSARPVRNYTRKHLPKDYFASLLRELLDAGGQPVSLDDVIESHASKRALPRRAFAVTFDDGFENNLTVAAPILRDVGAPATFYVTTGFVAHNRMSWIDRIELAVEAATPPRVVELPWGAAHFANDAEKRALLDEIRRRVKADRSCDADGLATELQRQLGLEPTSSSDDPLDQKMTWSQVRTLASDPLFCVGGHTHTHAILSFLDDTALAQELDTSLSLLSREAGIVARHYSYPEGLAHCYSDDVIEELRKRGIACCPTAEHGVNDAGTDLFRLRRILVT